MELANGAVTKVIGIGGSGGNVAEHMVRERTGDVEFFMVNTDAQTLHKTAIGQTIQIDSGIIKGLGAGANPEVSRNAADEDREALHAAPNDADMVFIAAGTDGGIGTGVAPVVVEVMKDLGIFTVAAVTKPFNFEGKKHMTLTEQGIIELSKHADSLIIIPNDRLLKALDRNISLLDAFGAADDVPKGAVQSIAELITRSDLVNVDFADVRTMISEIGYAVVGSGMASGEDRAEEAAEMAISSPLLENIDLSGARGALVNVTAGFDLRLDGSETVGNTIRAFASDNVTVVVSTSPNSDMNNKLRMTVVTTSIGIGKHPETTLVTNKRVQQPAMNRHQQHGVSPLTQEQKPTVKVVNGNTPQTAKESDYLDIPAFPCKQAD